MQGTSELQIFLTFIFHGLFKKHHMDKKVCEMFLFDKFAEMVPINHSIFFYNMEGNRGRQKHL